MKNINPSFTRWTAGFGAALFLAACFDAGQSPATDSANAKVDPNVSAEVAAAEKNGTEKPQLDKFVKIPKVGEDAEPSRLQTTDGDFIFVEGQWRPDVLPLAKSNIQRTFTGLVTDIKLVAGNTSSTACPTPYYKMDVDLNRRAGGKWIFPCILGGPASQAIYMPSVRTWTQSSFGNGPGRIKGLTTGTNGDMNQGASGKFIFGDFSDTDRGHLCKMAGIGFITDPLYPWALQTPPAGYQLLDLVDLNEGAGGDFIYLVGKFETLEARVTCPQLVIEH